MGEEDEADAEDEEAEADVVEAAAEAGDEGGERASSVRLASVESYSLDCDSTLRSAVSRALAKLVDNRCRGCGALIV